MAKKKNIAKQDILGFYMDDVLTHGQQPHSVFAFAKTHNFEESKFYEFYGSFSKLESDIFVTFFKNTLNALYKSEDYKNFDARNKLLSFYFTFFENLTANRSYVVYALESHKNRLKSLQVLSDLRTHFRNYIGTLDIKTLDLKQEQLDKIQDKGLKESAWFQLLVTLKFWLGDSSPSFEKTDLFIEKSVKASFDLMDTTPLHSLIDLGKFLFKEKVRA